jgi:hypothetical protein
MARVEAVYEIVDANQANPPQEVGLYVGKNGVGQTHLTDLDTKWMEKASKEQILQHIVDQETRRRSPWYLYGHENDLLTILFIIMVLLFIFIVLRLVFRCLSRLLQSKNKEN